MHAEEHAALVSESKADGRCNEGLSICLPHAKKPLQPLYFAVRLEAATTALKAAVEKVQPEASAWASSRLRSCGRVQTKLVESSGMVS